MRVCVCTENIAINRLIKDENVVKAFLKYDAVWLNGH